MRERFKVFHSYSGVRMGRRINDAGLALIKRFEGLELTAYRDAVGVLTIGYGHTGPDVKREMTITHGEAERLLLSDLSRFENGVEAMLTGYQATDGEFSAMVSLSFNIGLANLATSTLLKRHKLGNRIGAANAFLMWDKARNPATGQLRQLPGLIRRREAERKLYLGES